MRKRLDQCPQMKHPRRFRQSADDETLPIGSIGAQMPRPNAAAYSCAKIALVALTKTTALEGRESGVIASCIHPGNVNTEQMTAIRETPNESMMNVDAVVKAVMTMATLLANVNMVEAIILLATQPYLGAVRHEIHWRVYQNFVRKQLHRRRIGNLHDELFYLTNTSD